MAFYRQSKNKTTVISVALILPFSTHIEVVTVDVYNRTELDSIVWQGIVMVTSRKERLELLAQFGNDIARIQHCLLSSAHTVTSLQAVSMWSNYSENHCAIWMGLPVEDKDLLDILVRHLPSTTMLHANPPSWQLTLVDAGDESGDAVLLLPDDLLMQLGWDEGDTLEVSIQNDQLLVVRKM